MCSSTGSIVASTKFSPPGSCACIVRPSVNAIIVAKFFATSSIERYQHPHITFPLELYTLRLVSIHFVRIRHRCCDGRNSVPWPEIGCHPPTFRLRGIMARGTICGASIAAFRLASGGSASSPGSSMGVRLNASTRVQTHSLQVRLSCQRGAFACAPLRWPPPMLDHVATAHPEAKTDHVRDAPLPLRPHQFGRRRQPNSPLLQGLVTHCHQSLRQHGVALYPNVCILSCIQRPAATSLNSVSLRRRMALTSRLSRDICAPIMIICSVASKIESGIVRRKSLHSKFNVT